MVLRVIILLIFLLSLEPLEGLSIGVRHEDLTDLKKLELEVPAPHASRREVGRRREENPGIKQQKRAKASEINVSCSQDTIERILEECKVAVSPSNEDMFFCGPHCSHLAFNYAHLCNMNEFVINVSGACKLKGANVTVQCIYATVIVKDGLTTCAKRVVDIEANHNISSMVDSTQEYIDSQCCSLQCSHSNTSSHDVFVERNTGKILVEPPLLPPWTNINASEYQPLIDVTSSELCLKEEPYVTNSEIDINATINATSDDGSAYELTTNAAVHHHCKHGLYLIISSLCLLLTQLAQYY